MPVSPDPQCPLCAGPGGELVWSDDRLRVILAAEPAFPGFTRVVWQAHVAEMTDLAPADRDHLMHTVYAVEAVQRRVLGPDKINLAALGNMVPHVHWHVIPRWRDDAAFPDAVWAPARRAAPDRVVDVAGYVQALREALAAG
ncbi:HIT family protein [Achromobacter sp. GG226]|uniref:HIT family protein n=1 Tax=Verticiella alkaliphila TaxID=2779529 RepID=UPI001C0B1B54|nr:HIT family protein [Verticiella sp. GG226]MBU4611085.1 HIT family protein [Verticiella sp. GG226]